MHECTKITRVFFNYLLIYVLLYTESKRNPQSGFETRFISRIKSGASIHRNYRDIPFQKLRNQFLISTNQCRISCVVNHKMDKNVSFNVGPSKAPYKFIFKSQ